ncbi:hypothetical protein [uncultured Mailhella sp.]|uniref:hypothetical protein n=1 Tax=uncultured Mailhella sp. TaxID=1981031 RepID=UPI0025F58B76|nr:hypothetical protein [uncultured Mailhella sp.]
MVDTRAMEFFRCPVTWRAAPRLSCLKCKTYPCRELTREDRHILEASPFVTYGQGSALISRRRKMYLFRMNDGTIVDAYAEFDPNKPDFAKLADVQEVLVVGKVLEKQIRLVAKPKEERDALIEEHRKETEAVKATQPTDKVPVRQRRRKQ